MLDTVELHQSLERLSPEQRVAFSAACLEALVTQFGQSAPGSELLPKDLLMNSVALCWRSVSVAPEDLAEVEKLYKKSESIIDDTDEGLFIAEHVLAGICYTLRAIELRSSEYAVLVANNWYEAADYAITIEDPELSDEEILKTTLVSGVLRNIPAILSEAASLDAKDADAVVEFRREVISRVGHQVDLP